LIDTVEDRILSIREMMLRSREVINKVDMVVRPEARLKPRSARDHLPTAAAALVVATATIRAQRWEETNTAVCKPIEFHKLKIFESRSC
jgi:hypothetical protein